MKRPGQFNLLFMLSDVSRTHYLTLDHDERKRVIADVCRAIRETVDPDHLATWLWANDKIETDDDGSALEEEIGDEIAERLEGLGSGGNVITISNPGMAVVLGGDKRPDCGASRHAAYSLNISRDGGPPTPWIIASSLHPQLLFEMRAAVEWIGLPLREFEITPLLRTQPAKGRKPAVKRSTSRKTGRRGGRKRATR